MKKSFAQRREQKDLHTFMLWSFSTQTFASSEELHIKLYTLFVVRNCDKIKTNSVSFRLSSESGWGEQQTTAYCKFAVYNDVTLFTSVLKLEDSDSFLLDLFKVSREESEDSGTLRRSCFQ